MNYTKLKEEIQRIEEENKIKESNLKLKEIYTELNIGVLS